MSKLEPTLRQLMLIYIDLIRSEQVRELSHEEEYCLNIIRKLAKRDYELRELLKQADQILSYQLEDI